MQRIEIIDRFLLQPGKIFLEKWSPWIVCHSEGLAPRSVNQARLL